VESRVGDGFFGWPEVEGGFDIILVTAQAPFVPPALLGQLKKGGRMIIPIGSADSQQLQFIRMVNGQAISSAREMVRFVPLVPNQE